MKAKNQLVVISGILVLLATAAMEQAYNIQTAKAVSNNNNFGNTASFQAHGGIGAQVPQNPNGYGLAANSNCAQDRRATCYVTAAEQ